MAKEICHYCSNKGYVRRSAGLAGDWLLKVVMALLCLAFLATMIDIEKHLMVAVGTSVAVVWLLSDIKVVHFIANAIALRLKKPCPLCQKAHALAKENRSLEA